MCVFIVSRSGSNWFTWDDNLGHRSKSKENLVNTVEVAFLSNHHKSCSKCFACWFLGQVWKWVTWGQKLGHWFKSQANLVNTLEVTFWNVLKMFGLLILGQVQNFFTWGQKLGRQAKLKENVNTLRVYIFLSDYHESCSKCLVLIISRSSLELGHLWPIFHCPVIFLKLLFCLS